VVRARHRRVHPGRVGLALVYVLFANFAEAMAEGGARPSSFPPEGPPGRQAKRLARPERGAAVTVVPGTTLRKDDVVLAEAGTSSRPDGEVIEGIASVNESASRAKARRHPRERRRPQLRPGGTQVLSDWLIVRVTANPGEAFLDR